MTLKRVSLGAARRVGRQVDLLVASTAHRVHARRSSEDLLREATGQADLEAFVAAFRKRPAPPFFFEQGGERQIAEYLARAAPGWRERTKGAADALLDRVVRLFERDRLELAPVGGCALPWHTDPLHGYAWDARTFYRRIRVPYDVADIKVPWELSRCQHLPTLGMAFAATGDERYAREAVAQIDDWISCNRPGYGVNWACTMDVAIRAVNWLWTYQLIAGSAALDDRFLTRFLASLAAHGRHISRNIERYEGGITTNHTLADFVGLVYLGLLLPEFRSAAEWVRTGVAGVVECMRFQVNTDGVDFENSIAYHRLVLEMFAGVYVLCGRAGVDLPADYGASLERMFDFVYHYTRPDGLAPLVGDSDDGRLQILADYFGWEPQDHRSLLAAGAAIFDRADWAAEVPGYIEEAAWLCGSSAADRVVRASGDDVARESRAFPASGRYVMRHLDHFALVSADEVGTAGLGNHKHNDIFGFELVVGGAPVAVDPGSFTYTGNLEWRSRFRATAAHNTVVVDRVEQNEPLGAFAMRRDARVEVSEWRSTADYDLLEASHDGYRRLAEPVSHRRLFWFRKDPFAFLVLDRLEGSGEHEVDSYLHLAAGSEVRAGEYDLDAARAVLAEADAAAGHDIGRGELGAEALHVRTSTGVAVTVVALGWPAAAIETGWVSPRYGRRVEAPVVRWTRRLGSDEPAGYLIVLRAEQ
jgi:hypothetical protein